MSQRDVMAKRMTAADFERIREHLKRMKVRSVEAAYDYLVNGESQAKIAERLDITRKAVNTMVSQVWDVYIKNRDTPEGWERFEVTLPAEIAAVVRNMQDAAYKALGEKNSGVTK